MSLPGYSEHGLLGLALDPDFTSNHYVYLFYSEPDQDGNPARQRLVRFTEVDGIEHTGLPCSLDVTVGPDGAVYFSTADTIYRWGSQRLRPLSTRVDTGAMMRQNTMDRACLRRLERENG